MSIDKSSSNITTENSTGLPYLRRGREVLRRQQERVNTILRERGSAQRLVREPDGKLVIRGRLETAPDLIDVGILCDLRSTHCMAAHVVHVLGEPHFVCGGDRLLTHDRLADVGCVPCVLALAV